MHGSSVREVERHLRDWHAPALADMLTGLDLGLEVSGVRGVRVLVVAADAFVYLGDLRQVFEASAAILRHSLKQVPAQSEAETKGGSFIFTVEHLTPSSDGDGVEEEEAWRLQESGRFCHSESYIRGVAAAVHARSVSITQIVPRTENGKDIHGLLVEVHF